MSTPCATSLNVVPVSTSSAKKKSTAPPQEEEISWTNTKVFVDHATFC